MENFNKESTSQQPYWNPENRAAGAGSSPGTAARMKLADNIRYERSRYRRKVLGNLDDSTRNSCRRRRRHSSTLHLRGDQISGAAHSAANKIHATANYVRQTNVKGMVDDFEDILKRYPAQTLAAAALCDFS